MELEDIDYFEDIHIDTPEVVLQVFTIDGKLEEALIGYESIQSYVESKIWKHKKKKNGETESNNYTQPS